MQDHDGDDYFYCFEKHLPKLASVMGQFEQITGLTEMGYDSVRLREHECWPAGLEQHKLEGQKVVNP